MRLHELSPVKGAQKKPKRVGRGPGSSHGKTSCRGHKGQKSRSGGGPAPGFEGGQMPLQRRIPKRGFRNPFRVTYEVINVQDLNAFAPNSEVDVDALVDAGLVKPHRGGIKLLGEGELSHPVRVRVHKASRTARDKVEAAGGAVELM